MEHFIWGKFSIKGYEENLFMSWYRSAIIIEVNNFSSLILIYEKWIGRLVTYIGLSKFTLNLRPEGKGLENIWHSGLWFGPFWHSMPQHSKSQFEHRSVSLTVKRHSKQLSYTISIILVCYKNINIAALSIEKWIISSLIIKNNWISIQVI